MARIKRIESCLFCGNTPCSCLAKPVKIKKKAIVKADIIPAVSKSDVDFGEIPVAPPRFKEVEKPEPEIDLSFLNALRSLREIVCKRDQCWIDDQLNPPYPQDLDKRISEWRRRHGK